MLIAKSWYIIPSQNLCYKYRPRRHQRTRKYFLRMVWIYQNSSAPCTGTTERPWGWHGSGVAPSENETAGKRTPPNTKTNNGLFEKHGRTLCGHSNLEKCLEIEGLLHGIKVVKSKFWVSKVLIYRKSCLHAYWWQKVSVTVSRWSYFMRRRYHKFRTYSIM